MNATEISLSAQRGNKGEKAQKAVQLPRWATACLTASAKESPMPKRPTRALRAKRLFSCPVNSLPAKAVLPLSKEGEFMLA